MQGSDPDLLRITCGNGSRSRRQVGAHHGRLERHRPRVREGVRCRRLPRASRGARSGAAGGRQGAARWPRDIPGGTLETLDEEKWRHAWELKVFSYINLSRLLYARMKSRRAGVILNVVGMAAEHPTFEYICGSTANAGLAAFTRALGKGTVEHGVRVLGVHPPSTRTERIVSVMKGAAKAKFCDENRYPELAGSGPFAGMMEPEQVADVIVFLASPRCAQISGVVLSLGP